MKQLNCRTIQNIRDKLVSFIGLYGKYPTHITLNQHQINTIRYYIKEDKNEIYNMKIVESKEMNLYYRPDELDELNKSDE